MSIGSTIRQLRRAKNITQEQLAEYLGITSRAVSQWECDRTAPDLSQIPALCHVFNVSSDTLLGIDVEKSKEAAEACIKDARERYLREGKFEEYADALREANRRFPRSYPIMHALAEALVSVYSRQKRKDYAEVIALCRRILEECTDSHLRYETVDTLITTYHYAGMEREEKELMAQMPRVHQTYEHNMVYSWEGNEGLEERHRYMSFLIRELLAMTYLLGGHMDDGQKWSHTHEERTQLRRLLLELLDLIYPDGDYHQDAYYGNVACSFFVNEALRAGDMEALWYWIGRGADFAIHSDTYDFDAPHTSPLLRGYRSGGWIMESHGNHSQIMLDWLTTEEKLIPHRQSPRYLALVDRLRQVAKKP